LPRRLPIVGPSRIALQQTLQPIVGNNPNAETTARFHRQRTGAVSASFTAQSDFIPAQSLPNPCPSKNSAHQGVNGVRAVSAGKLGIDGVALFAQDIREEPVRRPKRPQLIRIDGDRMARNGGREFVAQIDRVEAENTSPRAARPDRRSACSSADSSCLP
jgi:hypothetical protein